MIEQTLYLVARVRKAPLDLRRVRIELFVADPTAVHRALAAGAAEYGPDEEYQHSTTGLQPIRWILQGSVVDPFGMYRIGKILE